MGNMREVSLCETQRRIASLRIDPELVRAKF